MNNEQYIQQGQQNIENFVNRHISIFTRQLLFLSRHLENYIIDSRNLNNLSDDELFNITNLLIQYSNSLISEIFRIYNDIEALGGNYYQIIQKAHRLKRRAILVIKKNTKEMERRGLNIY